MSAPISQEFIPNRAVSGLRKRISIASELLRAYTTTQRPRLEINYDWPISETALLLRGTLDDLSPAHKASIFLRAIHFSNQLKSISEQLRLLALFRDQHLFNEEELRFISCLAVGSTFVLSPRDPLPQGQEADFSIFALPIIARSQSSAAVEALSTADKAIQRFFKHAHIQKIRGWDQIADFLLRFSVAAQMRNLTDLSNALHGLKQIYWPLFGADVFSFMQLLVDPFSELIEDQIGACMKLCELWGFGAIANRMMILRAVNGYRPEKEYTLAHLKTILGQARLPDSIVTFVEAAITASQPAREYIKLQYRDHLVRLLCCSLNVAVACGKKDIETLKRILPSIYVSDPSFPYFLNWLHIHRSFPLPSSVADPHTMFIKSLMGSAGVARRFQLVAISRGTGALTADLTSYIERLRKRPGTVQARTQLRRQRRPRNEARSFVRKFAVLPPAARAKLIEQILEKEMIERIAFAFPLAQQEAASLPRGDGHASLLRIELTRLAAEQKIITSEIAGQIIKDETDVLRMLRFEKLFQTGRIRIDWKYLENEFQAVIDNEFGFLFRGSWPSLNLPDEEEVLKVLGMLLSERLAELALFESRTSLEQMLSNNLRHGVLVPRGVRAFSDALAKDARRRGRVTDVSDAAYVSEHGRVAGTEFLRLRDYVQRRMQRFQDHWLRIELGGEAHKSLITAFAEIVISYCKQADAANPNSPAFALVEKYREIALRLLKEAQMHFITSVREEVFSEIHQCRTRLSASSESQAIGFVGSVLIWGIMHLTYRL